MDAKGLGANPWMQAAPTLGYVGARVGGVRSLNYHEYA